MLSCLLAVAGVTGARTIFEGEFGVCRTFSRNPDPHKILEALGQEFHINGFRIKRYPCGGFAHPYIEAALSLRENNFEIVRNVESINAMTIEGRKLTGSHTELDVRDVLSAQYSIPYAVAVTLCHGRPTTSAFSDEGINDPVVKGLLQRCELVRREDYPGIGRVTAKLKDGRTLTGQAIDPQKSAVEVDKQEILNKAIGIISPSLGLKGAQGIVEALANMVAKIEDTTDIQELIASMPVFALKT